MVGTVLQKTRQNAQIFNSMYTYVIGNIPLLVSFGLWSFKVGGKKLVRIWPTCQYVQRKTLFCR